MKKQDTNNPSSDFALSRSFSRRQMTMMNSYLDSSVSAEVPQSPSTIINPARCLHCGKYYCQIDFIFSWLSRYGNSNDQQCVVHQRIQEIISKRLPSSDPQNVCEQRLLDWYNSMKINLQNESIRFSTPNVTSSSISGSFLSNSLIISHQDNNSDNSIDYNQYLSSQSHAFPPDEPLLSSNVCNRLSSSTPSQTFQTQNRAGLYQLCSNGRYIIADDWCQTYKGHRLAQFMRCLTIYNQYEEQCVLMLPEFNTMTQMDSVQSMTWHEQLQVFLFITFHRIYQCEPESGTINQINEYEVPSSRHSLAHIACDQQSYVFLAYEYPAASLDLWYISTMATWSLLKRWAPRELFPPVQYDDEDEEDHREHYDQESGVCGIASMRYTNGTLHFLARHERHWCLHLFTLNINEKYQKLIPQRRIDIDLAHLRFAGENFQMEVLPGEQGWLFAIRRSYLVHLSYNGKDAQKLLLPTSKRGADSIYNVCIMDERGKRRENGKHLVVRDANSIRFYKL
ncbi:unnamed protein product [Rotaria magnacalcarata]|uniref:Uncharacterized protein n=1 Tax=Rotaria magnacalcarata TaxID=392030 RepID=A0A816EHJ5_9BILA|nr:unnamed protein product [Rotaria magnacalcarata]CAF1646797.1 unnamed protein product [Rotaria magnacalcarata]CAF1951324.1 unnamed protein product [Rotaria magnacalcarata]CAF2056559.1 unnamed protein product [Rotaria magnacalcarata]CAF2217298.1 unnamed protein product [Rotaria magnacalcarata]